MKILCVFAAIALNLWTIYSTHYIHSYTDVHYAMSMVIEIPFLFIEI